MVDRVWEIWSSLDDFGLVISFILICTREAMENDFGKKKVSILQNTSKRIKGRKYLEPHVIYFWLQSDQGKELKGRCKD